MKVINFVVRYLRAHLKFYFAVLLTSVLFIAEAKSQSFPYRISSLTVDDGLSHTDANDIAQDEKGFMWVATFFGLDRYDGYSIKKYYNSNEPLDNAFRNRLNCIYPDNRGNVWLGTEAGIQCFDAKTETYMDYREVGNKTSVLTKIYKAKDDILFGLSGNQIKIYILKDQLITEKKFSLPINFKCSDMTADRNGIVYLSSNLGLWTLNEQGSLKKVEIAELPQRALSRIYFDAKNNLVLTAEDKLFLIYSSPQQNSSAERYFTFVKQFAVPDHRSIKDITKSNNSDYFINTGPNLYKLDKDFNLIQNINSRTSQHKLNANNLSKIFIDRSECLWICTFGGGVNYLDLNEKLFYTLQHNPENENSLSGNHIRSVVSNGDDVWIGTTSNGLNLYNSKNQKFTHYNSFNTQVRLKSDEISSLTLDNDHNLWIGSGAGIQILKPNKTDLWQPSGYEDFPKYVIETLTKDYFGNIWFGNHADRLGVIWKDKGNSYHVKYYGVGYFIFADKNKPQLFISSTDGLKRVEVDKFGNIIQETNYRASTKPNSLNSNYTYPVVKQDDQTYWVGTIGGGLNLLKFGTSNSFEIKNYDGKYGIFNDVESMEIDNRGYIWMGGNGLERFNPRTEKVIRYDQKDGLQGNSFKVGSSYKGADGRLFFGGINGLNYFMPAQIISNKIAAKPILTDILINNSKPSYGHKNSTKTFIKKTISYSKEISLNYLQNNFVIYFSSMHYANPLKCKYRYKLVGFDKEWNYTDGRNPSAAYNNLNYNSYKFLLEASNNDGVWSKEIAETTFNITPPWWKSTLAKVFYVLLILMALIGIYIYQARWYRLKRELEVRAINEERREEMHKQKEELYQQQLIFFTNISHEFRTPLTLILSPLENLISQNKDSSLDNSYQLMLKNAKRLINLISELMNFKKVSDSVIKLQVQPIIIKQFCEGLASEFHNLSVGKDIRFKMSDHTKDGFSIPTIGWFDIQILEKILFNLLNNSFKYTDTGGTISFDVATELTHLKSSFIKEFRIINENYKADRYLYFRIADSGIGISEESINRIFERYYRISKSHLGSGVGLALVKSLTLLHKGNIFVYSEKDKGTEIIIAIPWGANDYTDLEKADEETDLKTQLEPIDNAVQLPLTDLKDQHHPEILKGRKNILLVDDNKELRNFLAQVFETHYNILEAEDGLAAIEIATETVPDLIISDVMMPKMDGVELCKIMKDKFETSHVPFIILSAKDALDAKIEGIESGADYYFAKPLSTELLLLTVRNIFEQREKIKNHYSNNYLAEATELVQSEKDKAFLNRLVLLIEENIQEPGLDVDYLCNHLFISRTKLYQKIKSISDQSVGEFIRTIRLKKAIQIMTHEDVTMNEVADRIGLQSSSNFSRTFKREYGKSPLQFMQALKNDK
ncbi:signal transduction histidine kinase/DNA-binding response OmpR family regulator/ligand-binding sensor domain-containing protein [Pedobacter sp. UYEF25]